MKTTLFLILLISGFSGFSQADPRKTVSWTEGTVSPKADLRVIDWLSGHWRGEAMGGITEEIWSPTLGGVKMFSFRLIIKDKTVFYEFGFMAEENGTLVLRLKHFDPDFKGWEEKDKYEDFKLIKVSANKVFFDGFTFEKVADNEINMYVMMEEDGKPGEELVFNYKRFR